MNKLAIVTWIAVLAGAGCEKDRPTAAPEPAPKVVESGKKEDLVKQVRGDQPAAPAEPPAVAPAAGQPPAPPAGGGLYKADGFSVELPAGRTLEFDNVNTGYAFQPSGAAQTRFGPVVQLDTMWQGDVAGLKKSTLETRKAQGFTIVEDTALGNGHKLITSKDGEYEVQTFVPGKQRAFVCKVSIDEKDKDRLKADLDICLSLKSLE